MNRLRLLWLVAFPLEGGAMWLLFTATALPSILAGLALHVIAAGVFGASLLTRSGDRWLLVWPLLGGALALLAFPMLGMLSMAAAYTLAGIVGWRAGQGRARVHDAAEIDSGPQDAVARAHEVEVALLDELEIEPVVDVLRENDPELKRAAIEAISRQGGPGTVRILIGLLHDPSPDARFFASIALSRLEDEISRAILAAQHTVAEQPNDAEAGAHLAQLYLDYAESGFLEGATRDYYLDLARQTFEAALPASPQPDDVLVRLARVYLLQHSIGETAAVLDELARRRPTDLDLHLLRMDAIYQFGDFHELEIYARRALPAVVNDPVRGEVIEWWATAGPEEVARAS